jgi:hypothetical protein
MAKDLKALYKGKFADRIPHFDGGGYVDYITPGTSAYDLGQGTSGGQTPDGYYQGPISGGMAASGAPSSQDLNNLADTNITANSAPGGNSEIAPIGATANLLSDAQLNNEPSSGAGSQAASGGISALLKALGIGGSGAGVNTGLSVLSGLLAAAGKYKQNSAYAPTFNPPPLFGGSSASGAGGAQGSPGASTGYGPAGGYNYQNYAGANSSTPGLGYAPRTQTNPNIPNYYTYGQNPQSTYFSSGTPPVGTPSTAQIGAVSQGPTSMKKGGHVKKFALGGINSGDYLGEQLAGTAGTSNWQPPAYTGPLPTASAQDPTLLPKMSAQDPTPTMEFNTPGGLPNGGGISGISGLMPPSNTNQVGTSNWQPPAGGGISGISGLMPPSNTNQVGTSNWQPPAGGGLSPPPQRPQWGNRGSMWQRPQQPAAPQPQYSSTPVTQPGVAAAVEPPAPTQPAGGLAGMWGGGTGQMGTMNMGGGPPPWMQGFSNSPVTQTANMPPAGSPPWMQGFSNSPVTQTANMPPAGSAPVAGQQQAAGPTAPQPATVSAPVTTGTAMMKRGGPVRYAAGGDATSGFVMNNNPSALKTMMAQRKPYGMPPTTPPVTSLPNRGMSSGGSRHVQGPGDGTSDSIPARLANGEYVMDAQTVSMAGNGDNGSGAKALDQFRENLRKHKGGALAKGKMAPDTHKDLMKYLPKGKQ